MELFTILSVNQVRSDLNTSFSDSPSRSNISGSKLPCLHLFLITDLTYVPPKTVPTAVEFEI